MINSPVLTAYGLFRLSGPLTKDSVNELLSQGFTSAVGHASTAQVLSQILGQPVPMQRITITMQPGDKAVVMKMQTRLAEGAILDAEQLSKIEVEFGLLERIE